MTDPDIDYYAYKPLIRPDRPLALVGLPAAHVGGTARLVSSFTGLPLFWLDRAVEHRAGASIDAIVVERGLQARREHERALVPPVLDRPVPHIMALSEVCLADDTLRSRLIEETRVVFLQRSLDEVVETVRAARARKPTAYARLLLGQPLLPGPLREELSRMEQPMQSAPETLDVSGLHPQHACRALLQTLGWELPQLWKPRAT